MNPMLIAAIVSAIASTAQGIGNASANDAAAKRNKEKLNALLKLEDDGSGLGLSPEQKQSLDQRLNVPIAQAAQAGQNQAEGLAAAAGSGASGADLARLRQESSSLRANGAQEAALAITAANQAEEDRKKNEIEQRLGLKTAYKRDDINSILGPLAESLGGAGQAAGAPPAAPAAAPAGAPAASTGMPGATTLPATGAGAEAMGGASAAEGAAAVAGGGAMLGRSQGSQGSQEESGKMTKTEGSLSSAELKEFQSLAETDPQLFAKMFLASMAKKGAS